MERLDLTTAENFYLGLSIRQDFSLDGCSGSETKPKMVSLSVQLPEFQYM